MPAAALPSADEQSLLIRQRLQALRRELMAAGVQAVLVPSSDPHLSEYLPAHWQTRAWFSGFTGSAGTLVVAQERAALFTDSRYWEQAERELAQTGVELVRLAGALAPAVAAWLGGGARAGEWPAAGEVQAARGAIDGVSIAGGSAGEVQLGGVRTGPSQSNQAAGPQASVRTAAVPRVLAADGAVLATAQAEALRGALHALGWTLDAGRDLCAAAWPQRPPLPAAPVFAHRAPHAPTPRADKLAQLRQALQAAGATHHFIATLDDLAWLLNLRGSDVEHNPVFLGHLLVEPDGARLFVGAGKVDAALADELAADGVRLQPYEAALPALRALPEGAAVLLDPRRTTLGQRQALPEGVRVVEAINPTTLAKSRKTAAEAAFVRETMERDAAAMCAFYAWLESALGREQVTELTVDERLTAERARQPGFVTTSFATIAGFNANGALPHYRATPEHHAVLSTPQGLAAQGLLLIDSGGQYLGGTTDITRMWPVGEPSAAQRRDCTRVLKSLIALSRARFPLGTPSPMLDALARAPLWAEQLDYGHGTGHGVGYFLNVHEGPQSISKAVPEPAMAMQPGMITSIEPALYRPGHWGVRIENLVLNAELPRAVEPPGLARPSGTADVFLQFETLTLCPIDTRCLDLALLTSEERAWLDAYHDEVRRRVEPHVSGAARDWLRTRTQPA